MEIRQIAIGAALAASLAAQEERQGFNWVGFPLGSLSFDSKTALTTAPTYGLQGGRIFDQHRFGLSFDAMVSQPKSDLLPGRTFSHTALSLTLLTGLSDSGSGRLWPYFGQGLGAVSIPKIDPSTLELRTVKAGSVHVSLGFRHRPSAGFIWGLEGRYLFVFSNPDMKEAQGSLMAGFSWGGRPISSPPTSRQGLKAAAPPPVPLPLVPAVQPLPSRQEVAEPAPAPVVRPMVAVPQPAPIPPPAPVTPLPVPLPVVIPTPAPASQVMPVAPRVGLDAERTARLDALRKGDLALAVELGRRHIASLAPERWTLRLEVATLPSTLKRAVEAFPGGNPDLFIVPMTLKDGTTGYQLFLGDYPSKADAERASRLVPPFFLKGGQRPLLFPVQRLLPTAPMPLLAPRAESAQAVADPCCPEDDPAPPVRLRVGMDPERAARLQALLNCDMTLAIELGRKHLVSLPANRWTLRLEVAIYPCTLKRAVAAFPSGDPDLFIAPFTLPSGTPAYQLFLGDYATGADAVQAGKVVPPLFLEDEEIPIPYLVSRVPDR